MTVVRIVNAIFASTGPESGHATLVGRNEEITAIPNLLRRAVAVEAGRRNTMESTYAAPGISAPAHSRDDSAPCDQARDPSMPRRLRGYA
jgi:hypothetical protein